eukprot:CAMPEP_0177529372 /NCGR_PEP_ID=MMETSP0369-20130122/52767_1 /TAXON_ID=447022 ORGANISM="Scrippsiella hangoei-like, Strain SHHI-4" /NCGR_SAMPLE_ID=MMETSP0369 /ASSEMBLY_ACC=CAM_ASM_000364 /LENGTH=121 /DNA_ID=CAMNT_0019010029 /DNA_START=217 /DNA_END=580 /DNA_ORIENTATION=+
MSSSMVSHFEEPGREPQAVDDCVRIVRPAPGASQSSSTTSWRSASMSRHLASHLALLSASRAAGALGVKLRPPPTTPPPASPVAPPPAWPPPPAPTSSVLAAGAGASLRRLWLTAALHHAL